MTLVTDIQDILNNKNRDDFFLCFSFRKSYGTVFFGGNNKKLAVVQGSSSLYFPINPITTHMEDQNSFLWSSSKEEEEKLTYLRF